MGRAVRFMFEPERGTRPVAVYQYLAITGRGGAMSAKV